MSTSARFTHELARLVWLLVYRPAHVDDQKRALRVLLREAATSPQRVDHSEVAADVANRSSMSPLPELVPWLSELSTRMASHSVKSIAVHAAAKAAELLGLARALATQGSRNDHGQAFDSQIVALSLTTITIHLGRDGFVRMPTPPNGMRAFTSRPAKTPGGAVTSVADAVAEKGPPPAVLRTPRSSPTIRLADKPQMVESGFMPAGPANDLVIRLRGDLAPEQAPVLLDEITRMMEDAARHQDWVTVVDVTTKLMEREASVTHPDVKRAFAIQMKRLAKPGILRGVAELLPKHREIRDTVQAFLLRQGDPAADVLIELLTSAESASDRRAYRDAVRQCPSAAEPLVQLLRDHRWYVVRNAAELLGEMNATESDQELINTLRHRDARVRHAATLALIKLGTPRALHTIVRALGDPDASVRLKAALGLGNVRSPRAVPALLSALDVEEDPKIQSAIFSALGHHAADEAIARLIEETKPGPLLKRRPVTRRLAAIQALGDAGTHEARSALRSLTRDRDKSVRELVDRLLRDQAQEAVPLTR
ncbi:MAG: HEAT repeat domain-containing protein [Gemmatimonadaceae bacterium]